MPIARICKSDGATALAKVFDGFMVDLSVAAPDLPREIVAYLDPASEARAGFDAIGPDAPGRIAIEDVRLLAPIPAPEKFLGIGLNYKAHGAEAERLGLKPPETQVWFNKQVSCIVGPVDEVVIPSVSEKVDYEVELAVVIGQSCRYVDEAEARSVIGGYMVANDVSARDWQMRSPSVTLGKSFDTHGPTGPWLTFDNEIEDPQNLDLEMRINDEIRQSANTRDMVFSIAEQVSYLSQVMTLKPGDILATGTPGGVGIAMQPPTFVKPGDVMHAAITGLGHIRNVAVSE
ncbi:fumarylacetoacetate hydrolase family protein [Chachezhania sediminis]|uniref:fumarylacetoacetate hydrolase family protein n=1 Tax=Chachezhania sediminis TaxID=2599291 RepID=UPI00131DC186|nr:fumarylacetoacetate hydrolase family protein [Chachezhania sediminis]